MLNTDDEKLVFELSRPGRRAFSMPTLAGPPASADAIPSSARRSKPPVPPEVAERDLVRHYTRLSQRNYGIDLGFYPLGSCSMKYNPKLAEDVAARPRVRRVPPPPPAAHVPRAPQLPRGLERAPLGRNGMEP